MARRVSANRMELMNLKSELNIARRGHSLLKDKRDGLMQKFLDLIQDTVEKRSEVDRLLGEATDAMALASAVIDPEVLLQAMQMRTEPLQVEVTTESVMAVHTPNFSAPSLEGRNSEVLTDEDVEEQNETVEKSTSLDYGMVKTTGDIDIAFDALAVAIEPMLELATLEKKVQVMAHELEITRRRVNSLEHVLIPEIEETIKEIEMKMEENERQNIVRLMKVKDMILADEIRKKQERILGQG